MYRATTIAPGTDSDEKVPDGPAGPVEPIDPLNEALDLAWQERGGMAKPASRATLPYAG